MPLELFGFAISPLLVGLVEALKRGGLPSRDAPIAAIVIGIAAGFAVEAGTAHAIWLRAVIYGIGYGLAASGIYSQVAKFATPDPAPVAVVTPDPAPDPTPKP